MRTEKGFTFIEVLVALVVLSVTVLAFMAGLQTATEARALAQTWTTAESLASSMIESVKADPYVAASSGSVASYSVIDAPSNFTIATLNRNNNQMDGIVYGIPWNTVTNAPYTGTDPDIQSITVIILFGGKEVFRLKDFKVYVIQ